MDLSRLARNSAVRHAIADSRIGTWFAGHAYGGVLLASSHTFAKGKGLERLGWGVMGFAAALAALLLPDARAEVATLALFVLFAYAMPEPALAALPFSFVWSPKLLIFGTSGEEIYGRIDHSLVFGLSLYLVGRGRSRIRDGRLLIPLAAFLCAISLSLTVAVIRGGVSSPAVSFLYLIQLVQLSAVFVIAYSLGRRLGQSGVYAWTLSIVAAAAFGIAEQFSPMESVLGVYRTFERGPFDGQANHFAGLFVLGAAVGVALLRTSRWRVLGGFMAALSVAALFGTHSREGFVALGVSLSVLFLAQYPRWIWVAVPAALAFAVLVLPEWFYDLSRPGGSLFSRLVAWKSALSTFWERPLLGLGLGARHRSFYDNQYVLLVAETGLVGFCAFVLWLATLVRQLHWTWRVQVARGSLSLGILAGILGIAVQSGAAICFMVTVIAGPLLWMAGYALSVEEPESS